MRAQDDSYSYDESESDDSYWSEKVSRSLDLLAMINPSRIHNGASGHAPSDPKWKPKSIDQMIEIKHSKPIPGGRVLDLCSGGGNQTIASLELGATEVVSCDGSLEALKDMEKIIISSKCVSEFDSRKISSVQADANNLLDVFIED